MAPEPTPEQQADLGREEQAELERLEAKYAHVDASIRASLIEMDMSRWRDSHERGERDEEIAAEIDEAWEQASEQVRDALLSEYLDERNAKRENARRTRRRQPDPSPKGLGARLRGFSPSLSSGDGPAKAPSRWDYR